MAAWGLYPKQMRTVLTYIDALDAAESAICGPDSDEKYDTDVVLAVAVTVDGQIIGHLTDEIGGSWSFQPVEAD